MIAQLAKLHSGSRFNLTGNASQTGRGLTASAFPLARCPLPTAPSPISPASTLTALTGARWLRVETGELQGPLASGLCLCWQMVQRPAGYAPFTSRGDDMTIATVLLAIALILFVVDAVGVPSRVNLTAAGLACCVASVLVG